MTLRNELIDWGKEYRYACQLMLISIFMIIVSGICNRANVLEVVLVVIFWTGVFVVPGVVIEKLFPIKGATGVEKLLFGYVIGYVLSMLVYFGAAYVGLESYIRWIYLTIFVCSFLVLMLKRDDKKKNGCEENTWMVIILILFLFSLIVFSLKNAIPMYFDNNSWHGDMLYWIGDAVSLTKSVPPINFRTLDSVYNYHYFGALQISVISQVTGISVSKIALNYSYIYSMTLLGLSSYCLVKRIFNKGKIFLVTVLILLFSTGFEKMTGVTWFWHIFQVPMSFNVAISLEMIIMNLLLLQMERKDIDYNNAILMVVLLMVCTGTKGPSGAIVLCGIVIGIMYKYLFMQKNYKQAILIGGFCLFVFGLLYFFLLMPANTNYLQGANYDDPYKLSLNNAVVVNLKIIFWKTIKYFRDLFLINPWTFMPSLFYMGYAFKKRKIAVEDIVFSCMILAGTVLGYILHYFGSSQIYFSLSVFPFAAILAGKFYALITEYCNSRERVWVKKIGVIALFGGILWCALAWNWKGTLQISIRNGFQVLNVTSPEYQDISQMMTNEEYEAYEWIRNNTDVRATFISDRALEEGKFCYVPGVFTERYIYSILHKGEVEAATRLFQGDVDAIEYYKDKGIQYIIQNNRISPGFVLPEKYGREIYRNNEVVVWSLEAMHYAK